MMKNIRSQRRINHSLTQVLIVTAGLALMVSAPCTLAEHPTHLLNVSVQVEAISEPRLKAGRLAHHEPRQRPNWSVP